MTKSVWFWLLLGWAVSIFFSPHQVLGMFKSKSS